MTSGGAGAWRSRGRREAMPKPVSQTSPCGVDQDVGRLDVLVDEAAPVHLAERRRERDGDAQELRHLQRPAEQAIERLAAGILEHQHRAAVVARKRERSHRPFSIKFGLEGIFVFEPLERPSEVSSAATSRIGAKPLPEPR